MPNETGRSTHAFIAIDPACGHIVAAIAEDFHTKKKLAKEIGKWMADGYRVENVTNEGVKSGEWCKCHRKPKTEQLSLLEAQNG